MPYLLDISVSTSDISSNLELLDCFEISAKMLYTFAHDEKTKPQLGTVDFSNKYLIISLYLFRHSIELGIKALIEAITTESFYHHDIEEIWNEIPKVYKLFLSGNGKLGNAINVLKKYQILNDEQLFRYHIDQNENSLKKLPVISNPDYETLLAFVERIQQACRCCFHIRKKGPLNRDAWLPYLQDYDLLLMKEPPCKARVVSQLIQWASKNGSSRFCVE